MDSSNFMDVNGYYLKFLPKLPERNVLRINSTTSRQGTTIIPPNGFLVINIPIEWAQPKDQIIFVDPSQVKKKRDIILSFNTLTKSFANRR